MAIPTSIPTLRVLPRTGSVREVALLAYPIVLTQMSETVMHVSDSTIHRLFKFPGKVLLQAGGEFYPAEGAENRAFSNSPVVADLDGDGRPDLFWLNNDSPSRAYLNRSQSNAIFVEMPDAPAALGARVYLEGAGASYTREVASASGLGSDQSAALVFGLGAATRAERLVVSWADGRTTVIEDPPANRRIRIELPVAEANGGARSLAQAEQATPAERSR